MKYKITTKQNNSSNCMVCGVENEFGLKGRFYELENGELAVTFHSSGWHQSYPGRVHGGIAAAVLDELIGRAMCIDEPGMWGVTVELCVKYKKPVPTDADLLAVARVTKNSRKLFEGTGELLLPDGGVAATAWGKYMKMPIEKISGREFTEKEWFLIEEEDPEEIEI
ncbi:MAG: PaaI family thioesterase [Clostridiales bacterium]|nr:PaaI family thioesterase [Clostridiales bacterium]